MQRSDISACTGTGFPVFRLRLAGLRRTIRRNVRVATIRMEAWTRSWLLQRQRPVGGCSPFARKTAFFSGDKSSFFSSSHFLLQSAVHHLAWLPLPGCWIRNFGQNDCLVLFPLHLFGHIIDCAVYGFVIAQCFITCQVVYPFCQGVHAKWQLQLLRDFF